MDNIEIVNDIFDKRDLVGKLPYVVNINQDLNYYPENKYPNYFTNLGIDINDPNNNSMDYCKTNSLLEDYIEMDIKRFYSNILRQVYLEFGIEMIDDCDIRNYLFVLDNIDNFREREKAVAYCNSFHHNLCKTSELLLDKIQSIVGSLLKYIKNQDEYLDIYYYNTDHIIINNYYRTIDKIKDILYPFDINIQKPSNYIYLINKRNYLTFDDIKKYSGVKICNDKKYYKNEAYRLYKKQGGDLSYRMFTLREFKGVKKEQYIKKIDKSRKLKKILGL
jgi:hypothetical protein